MLRVGPALVVAQSRRPGHEGMIACLGAGQSGVDSFLRRMVAVGRGGLIQEDEATAVLTLEVGPPGATRVVTFVEERASEERRSLLVVADDEAVLRSAPEPEDERRKMGLDRLFRSVEDQLPHLVIVRRGLGVEP